ncbi:MAG: hypothetical protein V9G24_14470 [Rhodoblastus sp.]
MHRPATEEEARERDAIDGRVTFAIAAFVAAGGLIVLLDRVGVSERFIAAIGPTMALLALALIGILLRTMRISGFYAASRAAPPVYAGFATAAIATALVTPFTPPVSDLYSGAGVFVGFAFGLACAAFVTGPYLRRTGAFSISDLVGARFDNMALRLGAALLVGVSALLAAMAGFETAVSALSTIAGLSRSAAAVVVAMVLAVATVPGGFSGVLWAAVAAAGVTVAGFALPLLFVTLAGQPLPLPVIGDAEAWRKATSLISFWQGDSGQPVSFWLSLGMALGMAASAPLITPFITVRDRAAALRAGVGASLWSAALAAIVAATGRRLRARAPRPARRAQARPRARPALCGERGQAHQDLRSESAQLGTGARRLPEAAGLCRNAPAAGHFDARRVPSHRPAAARQPRRGGGGPRVGGGGGARRRAGGRQPARRLRRARQ